MILLGDDRIAIRELADNPNGEAGFHRIQPNLGPVARYTLGYTLPLGLP